MTQANGRILIVDDEKVNCNVLVALLEDYQTVVAKNGLQALQRAQSSPQPDLILLDVVMPEMDGYEVCQLLKDDEKTKNIPIIFITVKATEEEEAKGLKMGAVDYISKPFSPAIVHARVHNHIELKRQRDLLEILHVTDGLTGIPNRRRFDKYLDHEWRIASRMGGEISLIMIDIDHFKQYNDTYGHGAGDDCLKIVAQTIEKVCEREVDLVARYGGEEFVVVLPGTGTEGALKVAEVMRDAIATLKIPHSSSKTASHVTISLGIASGTPSKGALVDTLAKNADTALYQAKETGRNKFKNFHVNYYKNTIR